MQPGPEQAQALRDLVGRDVDRGQKPNHVVMCAAIDNEQPLVGAGSEERLAGLRIRIARAAVLYQLNADHQAPASDVADSVILGHQRPQPGLQLGAARGGIRDQALVFVLLAQPGDSDRRVEPAE